MSIFRKQELTCKACGTALTFELVHSISADRRPDLRDAILDGSFQRGTCPTCGTEFRVEPEFVYMDIGRGQYIGVWPASKRGEWKDWAQKTRDAFEGTLGKSAPPEAKRIGDKLAVRTVFGWPALLEKVLARQLEIDDRTLEAGKLAVMRSEEEVPLPGHQELRLVGEQDGDALLAWVGAPLGEDTPPMLRVPRQLFADIDAEPATWQALREQVAEGDVVDFQRELLLAA